MKCSVLVIGYWNHFKRIFTQSLDKSIKQQAIIKKPYSINNIIEYNNAKMRISLSLFAMIF